MTLTPKPSDFEARCNATYEALMWALSRPGLIRDLPAVGQAQIVDALIDRECSVHAADPDLADLAVRSGAARVSIDRADHVFLSDLQQTAQLKALNLGSNLHPENGVTLVLNADLTDGQRLRLTGPGVDGRLDVTVGGLPKGIWPERARIMRYPMGFEMFLVDGARVMGLPRSTKVEVL